MDRTPEQKKAAQQAFLTEFEKQFGSIKDACKAAGVGRRTFYDWIKQDQDFTALYEDAFEGVKDDVEKALIGIGIGKVMKGSATALFGYANARMKERGYGRTEHTGGGGGPIIFEIVDFASGSKGADPGKV